jgi:hypothetical protein
MNSAAYYAMLVLDRGGPTERSATWLHDVWCRRLLD